MIAWLQRLYSMVIHGRDRQPPETDRVISTPPIPPRDPDSAPGMLRNRLTRDGAEFLLALLSDEPVEELQNFTLADRAFLAGFVRKLRKGEIDIPVLPQAAIQMQQLLYQPNVDISDFFTLFHDDPTLTTELMRLANSTFYFGYSNPVHDLRQAIIRVGIDQILGLVMIVSLRSRILQSSHLQREVDWVTELFLAMARACERLGGEIAETPGRAFTRGLLHHIEYFVIFGVAAQHVAARRRDSLSREALIEAVCRFGRPVRELVIREWELEAFEFAEPAENAHPEGSVGRRELDDLQRAIILAWTGRPVDLSMPGITHENVRDAIGAAVPSTL